MAGGRPLVSAGMGMASTSPDSGRMARTLPPPPLVYSLEHFRLRVRSPSGAVTTLQVSPRNTVLELKQMVEVTEGTRIEEQRLVHRGVTMENDRSLHSYRVKEDSIVILWSQLKVSEHRFRMPSHERAPPASRGVLMVPGYGAPWRPDTSARVSWEEYEGHFDTSKLPAPWKISALA
uniref:Ubiquitin-like domain-containing protein n=1 Tax=Alexandrium monilatum TaxID=311494 RepID=A0A6T0RQW2_9DINO